MSRRNMHWGNAARLGMGLLLAVFTTACTKPGEHGVEKESRPARSTQDFSKITRDWLPILLLTAT